MRAKIFKVGGLILAIVLAVLALTAIVIFFGRHNVAVLQPDGTIGHKERNLMFFTVALCAIVVIPVFALTIGIALKYREGNRRPKKYRPDWDGDRRFEITWWAIPIAIISVLAVVTWISSYSLDPYRALASTNKQMDIDVVSLDWKWLFIYPEQNIATINYVRFPVNTPVDFHITSDSVMNSFWIPNLGGQIYAMPGMNTQLHLMADRIDSYPGSSANISGKGFADMKFTASASSPANFEHWVSSVRNSTDKLSLTGYKQLAGNGQTSQVAYYSSVQSGLFDWVVTKYMLPASEIPPPGTPVKNMNGMGM